MNVAIIIGFRDRGTDPNRQANLTRTLQHWNNYPAELITVSDGLTGQFNRHKAYNRGAAQTDADILAYIESDMLLDHTQLEQAITQAEQHPGLVVPFTERHELSPEDSHKVRTHTADYHTLRGHIIKPKPRRTGAINVISRDTYNAIGRYDEQFAGSWWDDRSMHRAFDICAGPTRWINGPSWHLHHLPGYRGAHLTPEDRAATAANQARWNRYLRATTPDQIRTLTTNR